MPNETMLCTLWVRAMTDDGMLVARNYVQFFIEGGFAEREETSRGLVLRAGAHAWTASDWSGGSSDVAEAEYNRSCYGDGHGFFEYQFAIEPDDIRLASKILVLLRSVGAS